MKPLERLKNIYPEDLVLIHEAGHVVLGHARNLIEGGIEFLIDDPYEVARAHWQETGATVDDKVVRSLAGIFIQALVIPKSVDENLRNHLFREGVTSATIASCAEFLIKNRCAGDWHKITEAFDGENLSESERVVVLNRCLDELRRVVKEKSLVKTAVLTANDIKVWLNTEDAEIQYAPMIFYSVTRSRAIFASVHGQPQRQ